MNDLYQFLSGAAALGAWTGGVFFLKFWAQTKDRLFLVFGMAFWIMALERVVILFVKSANAEGHSLVYLIRLTAFVLVLWAIADKNRVDGSDQS